MFELHLPILLNYIQHFLVIKSCYAEHLIEGNFCDHFHLILEVSFHLLVVLSYFPLGSYILVKLNETFNLIFSIFCLFDELFKYLNFKIILLQVLDMSPLSRDLYSVLKPCSLLLFIRSPDSFLLLLLFAVIL